MLTVTDATLAMMGFYNAHPFPGKLVFLRIAGSHSLNLAVENSDIDYFAVWAAPAQEFLGLHSPKETIDGHNPDFQSHEAGKFARLLLKGNPGVVETVFTEQMYKWTPDWGELQKIRDTFINKQTLKQYLGYCEGQLHRLVNGGRLHTTGGDFNTKWAYHLLRLVYDASRIAQGEPPLVFREDGPERSMLLRVRDGEFTPRQVEAAYRQVEQSIDVAAARIPETADEELLNNWLIGVRNGDFL